jgi:predicted transposase YbfD/YdcC
LSAQFVMPTVVSAIASLVTEGDSQERPDLWEVWAAVTDSRDRRGRRHSLASVLALVQAAVTSGATTFAGIMHWIGAAPEHVLADCRVWFSRRRNRRVPPSRKTLIAIVEGLDAAELDAAYARQRSAQMNEDLYDDDELIGLAVDGKAQRGTADTRAGTRARHRMGAFLHADAIMVATLDVDGKSNEIHAFAPLLDQIADLRGVVVTGDAMHCQRKHALYLRKRGAHYAFPVAGNQPGLFAQLDALAWNDVPIGWMTYDRGHGRCELRTIQTMPAPAGTRFPRAKQVYLIERHVTDLHGGNRSHVAVLGVTDLTPAQAGPRRLAEFARGQWSIENRDHYVRDVTLGEDKSRIRTASAPSVLATMRSYTISALRLSGFTNIAEGIRWARDDFRNPIAILGLTS